MARKPVTKKPEPSQAEADEIKQNAAGDAVAEEPAPTAEPTAPFPTQADLDAMKTGSYRNREIKTA